MKPFFLAVALSIAAGCTSAAECDVTALSNAMTKIDRSDLSKEQATEAYGAIDKLTTAMARSTQPQSVTVGRVEMASDQEGLWQLTLRNPPAKDTVIASADTNGVKRAALLDKPAANFRAGIQHGLKESLAKRVAYKVRVQGAGCSK